MKLSKRVAVAVGAFGTFVSGAAFAAGTSVLTTEMKTSLGTGFENLVATISDVIGTAWPFIIGAAVLMIAPSLVMKLINKATGR
jgi:hypothetical protein